MGQQMKRVAEVGRFVFLAAGGGVILVVLLAALFLKSVTRFPLAREAPNLTDKQAAALLAEKAEAADARKMAARYMLDATNFSPWL